METNGYSKSVIGTAKWIIGHFNNYCVERDISLVTVLILAEFVNTMPISQNSKERKIWVFTKYFEYLEQRGIHQYADIQYLDVHNYINSLMHAPQTIRCIKSTLREIYDWMYQ